MNDNSIPSWVFPVALIVLAIFALNMVFGLIAGIIGMLFGILKAILGFMFSKAGIFLMSVGLVYYLWQNRSESKPRSYDIY